MGVTGFGPHGVSNSIVSYGLLVVVSAGPWDGDVARRVVFQKDFLEGFASQAKRVRVLLCVFAYRLRKGVARRRRIVGYGSVCFLEVPIFAPKRFPKPKLVALGDNVEVFP